MVFREHKILLLMALCLSFAGIGQAASATLLKDGQMVYLNFTAGAASSMQGSRGTGKFRQGFDAAAGTFGPAKVLKHTATELRFKGRIDDCTLKADRTVTCKSGSLGTWR